jgi:transcriptional regulator with XRE-family HTH domain
MTLHQLAAECTGRGAPVSESQLSRIERGAVPRPALRAVLANLLGLDISDLEARPQ